MRFLFIQGSPEDIVRILNALAQGTAHAYSGNGDHGRGTGGTPTNPTAAATIPLVVEMHTPGHYIVGYTV